MPAGAPFVGARASGIEALARGGGRVIGVIRGDASLRWQLADIALEPGDILVVRSRDIELMGFREGAAPGARLPGLEPARARRSVVVEALVARMRG